MACQILRLFIAGFLVIPCNNAGNTLDDSFDNGNRNGILINSWICEYI
jgi:hypothetical protein